jgi:hypothetical protein
MLVTSTLLFIIFATRSGVDVLSLSVTWEAITPTQRPAICVRLEFLLGFALVLVHDLCHLSHDAAPRRMTRHALGSVAQEVRNHGMLACWHQCRANARS